MPAPVPRLVLLNGMPGVGKSTLAGRWVAAGAGRALVDPDVLRSGLTGDADDLPGEARRQALVAITTLLGDGSDVVVPQLVARVDQLERFEDVARVTGAGFVHVVLVDAADDPVGRFHRRDGPDPWHREARSVVAAQGGDAVLERYAAGLADVCAARPGTQVVRSVEGDLDGAWAALVVALTR